jgi:hypothetical protein
MKEITKDQRTEILGLLASGRGSKEVAEGLDLPYPSVLRVKREHDEAYEEGLVHEALPPTLAQSLVLDTEGCLEEEVQLSAVHLTRRIIEVSNRPGLEAREVQVLADALAKIQTAFFNQSSTNVNVLSQTAISSSGLGAFSELLKS